MRKLDRIAEAQRDDAVAAALRRELIDAHRTLGRELQELGRPESAARLFGAALALDDGDADLWQLRARMLNAAARREEALAAVERALALRPDSADYHLTRGVILRAMLRYEEARQCFENVVRLAPRHPGGYTNLGSLLDQLGDAGSALENYARAIALDPDCALAHWNRALVYLRRGDYECGWREYEWRWKAETLSLHNSRRHFPQPAWTGREALSGKTILLHAEQGLGDTLQFCRYATLVAQRGATVIVEAPPPLAELLGTLAGVDRVVARDAAPPPFDYHIPLMSLPLAFGTRPATVPGAPYLASDPARVARWDALLGPRTRPRVGVVWSGHPAHLNDHHRSVPLALMARLFAEVRWPSGASSSACKRKSGRPTSRCWIRCRCGKWPASCATSATPPPCAPCWTWSSRSTPAWPIWPARWASRCGYCCQSRSSGAGWSRARPVPGIRAPPCTASPGAATGRRSSTRWRRTWASWPQIALPALSDGRGDNVNNAISLIRVTIFKHRKPRRPGRAVGGRCG